MSVYSYSTDILHYIHNTLSLWFNCICSRSAYGTTHLKATSWHCCQLFINLLSIYIDNRGRRLYSCGYLFTHHSTKLVWAWALHAWNHQRDDEGLKLHLYIWFMMKSEKSRSTAPETKCCWQFGETQRSSFQKPVISVPILSQSWWPQWHQVVHTPTMQTHAAPTYWINTISMGINKVTNSINKMYSLFFLFSSILVNISPIFVFFQLF